MFVNVSKNLAINPDVVKFAETLESGRVRVHFLDGTSIEMAPGAWSAACVAAAGPGPMELVERLEAFLPALSATLPRLFAEVDRLVSARRPAPSASPVAATGGKGRGKGGRRIAQTTPAVDLDVTGAHNVPDATGTCTQPCRACEFTDLRASLTPMNLASPDDALERVLAELPPAPADTTCAAR